MSPNVDSPLVPLQTALIHRRRDFDALFTVDRFTAMQAVAYVASPALLLAWMRPRGRRIALRRVW